MLCGMQGTRVALMEKETGENWVGGKIDSRGYYTLKINGLFCNTRRNK